MKKVCVLLTVAVGVAALTGCTTIQRSATTGGIIGAMTGGIIGHQSGEAGAGAAIGAGVGALLGALAQDHSDHVAGCAIHEYHVCHGCPPPPYGHRHAWTMRVDRHCGYERKKVWVETSRDERVWVPAHYAGAHRIEGHYETKHIIGGYWKSVEEPIWIRRY